MEVGNERQALLVAATAAVAAVGLFALVVGAAGDGLLEGLAVVVGLLVAGVVGTWLTDTSF